MISWLLIGCSGNPTAAPWRAPDGGSAYSGPATSDGDAGCTTAGTDYASFIQPLFAARCLLCHSSTKSAAERNGAPVNVNFDTQDEVLAEAALIRLRAVVQRSMPPGAPLDDCTASALGTYLDSVAGACSPSCTARQCGSDGCGGECGMCAANESCDATTGQCLAQACSGSCQGAACGDDGCGRSCGQCAVGKMCTSQRQCVCAPQCDGKSCGDDGCGGSCGTCGAGEVCSLDGQCLCTPSCTGKVCGSNGCGGSCGSCASNQQCSTDQTSCACVANCSNRQCGGDGCGGSCGTCKGVLVCNTRSGQCQASCTPDCTNRVCGDDGCGGTCGGGCAADQTCTSLGQCVCAPNCVGRACGSDGCSGSCGSCSSGNACNASGQCVCTPNCSNRVCGDDGCGGSCGTCGGSQVCQSGACVTSCAPNCSGLVCGSDGCGGTCGSCSSAQTCSQGQCAWPSKSFGGDVFPIFQSAGCAAMACHSGARPAEGLDITTANSAYAGLVNVASTECTSRKRVAPGAPASSYLVNKLSGVNMCSGSRMPKGGAALSSAQMDVISAWIGSGAAP